VEYVLTTTHGVSTSVGQPFREAATLALRALNDTINQLQGLTPDARPFFDLVLRSPMATATVAGVFVLFVGLLLTRRA
jgi:hypothetical protein